MQGTMLKNQSAAVNGDDVVVRESTLECGEGFGILVGLVIRGDKDCTIDDEKVGMCGRKPFAIFVIAWIG